MFLNESYYGKTDKVLAIEKAFNELVETTNYGGDGIFVTNNDTGETYEE